MTFRTPSVFRETPRLCRGILTAAYGTVFDINKASYQKRVQISHELQPGETDRFTVKIAVAQSSSYCFRATIRDITGRELESLPIEMNCFVPRSRGSAIDRHPTMLSQRRRSEVNAR